MNSERKTCQNCKSSFIIEPEDFEFYDKIKVPAPTFCPQCRLVRRMIWRNERTLYKTKCDIDDKEIISVYSSDKPFRVYTNDYWKSDSFDPLEYGTDYDFSRPFFEQFKKLIHNVPCASLSQKNAVDSSYTNYIVDVKDSYLVFASHDVENCFYTSANNAFVKDCMDIFRTRNCELCYETLVCMKCFRLAFSGYCEECTDSAFLYNCKGCSHCFGCVNLRSKEYHIFNKPYSREEYFNKIKEFDLGSYTGVSNAKAEFCEFIKRFPMKYARIIKSYNVSGDDISNAKNCHQCFFVSAGTENCKYSVTLIDGVKDTYDVVGAGLNAELVYEGVSVVGQRGMFSNIAWHDHDLQYCDNCFDSSYLFACIGLRNKQYCILNKQYTKEEYYKLIPRIIQHMNDMPYTDKKGRIYKYGEFFPPELSPFAYNETIAQEYFPLTREQAKEQGYSWKDPETKEYSISIQPDQLPDHIKDVKDDILKETIGCRHQGKCNEQCSTAFRIIPQELEFYRKMSLPLPRLCPNCRHYQRLKQRNPLKLWHRKCRCAGTKSDNNVYTNTAEHFHKSDHCPNEFETSYSPDRKEIVYCEKCYQDEVV